MLLIFFRVRWYAQGSPLFNITLENSTLHKSWEDNQMQTYNQGQNKINPRTSFDDKVFPIQTTWTYATFKPKSQIKTKCELTGCRGSQRGFWTLWNAGTRQHLSCSRLPSLGWLSCMGKAEGRQQRTGRGSTRMQMEQHISANWSV